MFLGTGIILCLVGATVMAQQYHIVYMGAAFKGKESVDTYESELGGAFAVSAGGTLTCGVNFPDSAITPYAVQELFCHPNTICTKSL